MARLPRWVTKMRLPRWSWGSGRRSKVAKLRELAEEVAERLLAHPQPGGQFGWSRVVWAWVLEDD